MSSSALALVIVALFGACTIDTTVHLASERDGGGTCEPAVEACNGRDDDCDDMTDEDFDTRTDPSHCGECGNACSSDPAHGASSCVAGACTLRCDAGFADCDMDAANGCEAELNRPESCGDCATRCVEPTPLCQASGGAFGCVSTCAVGLTECGASCVDTSSDVSHCGDCDMPCPKGAASARSCVDGSCSYECDDGFGDCDGDSSTGCETAFTSLEHCGACDALCAPPSATGACVTSACEIGVCDAGTGDCNADVGDGCERSLTTLTDCGACDATCTLPHASATCSTGACELDACDPGFEDCNSDRDDGCETHTDVDPANCGGCGLICTSGCSDGGCGLGETTCDGMDDDGDGFIDEGTVCPCPVAHRMGHAYLFCSSRITWTSARDQCAMRGYALVTIDDAAENSFVSSTATATSTADRWWIGFNDRDDEGTWEWVGMAATGSYVGWIGSEPNNSGCCGGEDCAEIDTAGGWLDTECYGSSHTNHYVCEAS